MSFTPSVPPWAWSLDRLATPETNPRTCRETPEDPKAWLAAKLSGVAPAGTASLSTGYRTHTCNELRMEHVGQTVTLSGWVQKCRDQKGVCFVDIRDRYGITQVVFGDAVYEQAKGLGREFVIKVLLLSLCLSQIYHRNLNPGQGLPTWT